MITLIQGEDREINIGLKDAEEDVYIDLTGNTEISFKIAATLGGAVNFLKTSSEIVVTDATRGKFKVVMSDTKTALIAMGEQDIEVTVDWGSTRRIVQSLSAIEVIERLF